MDKRRKGEEGDRGEKDGRNADGRVEMKLGRKMFDQEVGLVEEE